MTRTALLTRVLVSLVLVALVVASVACFPGAVVVDLAGWASPDHGLYGVLQAAGLLFFAFAGYARIATLGEEVREPERVIPRAIVMALAGAVVVYAVVAVAVLSVLGRGRDRGLRAPVADAVRRVGEPGRSAVVRVGAALASAGALLALVAGLGRTGLAMARERDLPGWLDAVHPRFRVPHRAELTVAAVVVRAGADHRPARRDRLLVVRGAALLLRRQRRGVRPGGRRPPLPALAPAARLHRLPRPRRHPALAAVVAGLAVFAIGIALRVVRLRGL